MKQKIKVISIVLIAIAIQCIIYFVTKLLQGPANILATEFDNKIPLIPQFIYFYMLWYFMIFLVPCRIYQKDKKAFYEYLLSYMIGIIISAIIFVAYPTTVVRPNIESNTVSKFLLNWIYSMDTPLINCLPSIHCLLVFFLIYFVMRLNVSRKEKIIVSILLTLTAISTVFVKQHVAVDALASLIVVIAVCLIVKKLRLSAKIEKIVKTM